MNPVGLAIGSGAAILYWLFAPRSYKGYRSDRSFQWVRLRIPTPSPPLPLPLRLNSGVWRESGAYHGGVDLGAPLGTPVRAIEGGEISWSTILHPEAGNSVTIRGSTSGLHYTYAHLSAFGPKGAEVGTRVRAGDVIGYVGLTGHTTGPHLHLSIGLYKEPGRRWLDPLDVLPQSFFRKAT